MKWRLADIKTPFLVSETIDSKFIDFCACADF